jgi:hypothetical protein
MTVDAAAADAPLREPSRQDPVGAAASSPHPDSWLAQPQVLYAATAQMAANPAVSQRLDERLRDEIRRLIGALGPALDGATAAALSSVHWHDVADRSVAQVADAMMARVAADPRLAQQANAARARLAGAPSVTVASSLYLDLPLIDNPAMHADLTRALVIELAHLAGLGDVASQAVTQHSAALVNSSTATLDALVAQGRLTRQEEASLTTNLELAKLTHDNLELIRALLAAGVTSPVTLVGWTADQWHQLVAGQHLPVPPGETPDSYTQVIVHNLETTYPAHALAAHGGDDHLAILLARNPGLDVRTADLAGGAAAQLDWSGIPAQARERVEQELRSYQRLIPLARPRTGWPSSALDTTPRWPSPTSPRRSSSAPRAWTKAGLASPTPGRIARRRRLRTTSLASTTCSRTASPTCPRATPRRSPTNCARSRG